MHQQLIAVSHKNQMKQSVACTGKSHKGQCFLTALDFLAVMLHPWTSCSMAAHHFRMMLKPPTVGKLTKWIDLPKMYQQINFNHETVHLHLEYSVKHYTRICQLTINSQLQHVLACQIRFQIDLEAKLLECCKQVCCINVRTISFSFARFLCKIAIVDNHKMSATRMSHVINMFLIHRIVLRCYRLKSSGGQSHT